MNWIYVKDAKPRLGSWVVCATPIDEVSWYYLTGRVVKNKDLVVVEEKTPDVGWHWVTHWNYITKPIMEK
jgi:hypothetical protein